jgi:hypothetical protein
VKDALATRLFFFMQGGQLCGPGGVAQPSLPLPVQREKFYAGSLVVALVTL